MIEIHTTGAEDYGQYVKALIVGPPGSGKTLISSTAPHPLYASAESGLMSIARRRIKYAEVNSLSDLRELRGLLDQPSEVREKMFGHPVETLVVDTIDEIQKLIIRQRLDDKRIESLDMPGWGWVGEQMRLVLRALRNLDMNVIFTCHVKETTDQSTGQVSFKPALQGGVGDEIAQYMDLALLLRSEARTKINKNNETERYTVRFLQTYMDGQHDWIKDRSGQLPPDVEVNFEDDFARIHKAIFGFMTEDWERHAVMAVGAYQDIADDTKESKIEDLKNLDLSREAILAPLEELAEAAKGRETPAEVLEPVPEPEAPDEAPGVTEDLTVSPEPKPLDEEGPWICTTPDCGAEITSLDQKELSEIMIHRVACSPCYKAEVDSKKTKK